MSRLVLDRVVLRRGTRMIGPLSGVFGAGVHGVVTVDLDDRRALEETLGSGRGAFEGTMSAGHDGARATIVYLGDLLPLPRGYAAQTFATLLVGARATSVLARAGVAATARTESLAAREALAFALAIVAAMDDVGALIVPGPATFVAAHDEREAAARLRALAATGLPVLIFLGPGANEARWVDDVLVVDERGTASEARSVGALHTAVHAITVRGQGLDALASRMVRSGFEFALDSSGTELTVRAARSSDLERALTDALADHTAPIDEVVRCA